MIGMDVGTTCTKAAYVDPTGKPTMVLNDRSDAQAQAVVYAAKSGNRLVGIDAVEEV